MEQRPPEWPNNLTEWLWRLKRYEDGIYVRQNRGDRTHTLSLAELSPQEWGAKVAGFLEQGALPVRIKEPEEIQEVQDAQSDPDVGPRQATAVVPGDADQAPGE